MPQFELPDLLEIETARDRIGAHAHWTPLLSSRSIGELAKADVWLKCENLQKAGAFKFRGAMNACLHAIEEERMPAAGVITFSSGNHGQAVALAARTLGLDATIVVPEDIPAVKRAAIESYGARLEIAGLTSTDRHQRALELSEENGGLIVPPFDHPDSKLSTSYRRPTRSWCRPAAAGCSPAWQSRCPTETRQPGSSLWSRPMRTPWHSRSRQARSSPSTRYREP